MTYSYRYAENHFETLCLKASKLRNRRVIFRDQRGYGNLVIHARQARPNELVYNVESDSFRNEMPRCIALIQLGIKFQVRLNDRRHVILRLHSGWRKRDDAVVHLLETFVSQKMSTLIDAVKGVGLEIATVKEALAVEREDIFQEIGKVIQLIQRKELGHNVSAEDIGLHQVQNYLSRKR